MPFTNSEETISALATAVPLIKSRAAKTTHALMTQSVQKPKKLLKSDNVFDPSHFCDDRIYLFQSNNLKKKLAECKRALRDTKEKEICELHKIYVLKAKTRVLLIQKILL